MRGEMRVRGGGEGGRQGEMRVRGGGRGDGRGR